MCSEVRALTLLEVVNILEPHLTLELTNIQLMQICVFTPCLMPAEALKPCSLNVPVAILYLPPESLTITVQAASTLEKKWFWKKPGHDCERNGMIHSSHQMHMPPQPVLTPLSTKIWVNVLRKNYAAPVSRSEIESKVGWGAGVLPAQEILTKRLLWARHCVLSKAAILARNKPICLSTRIILQAGWQLLKALHNITSFSC